MVSGNTNVHFVSDQFSFVNLNFNLKFDEVR